MAFLGALVATGGNIVQACKNTKIDPSTPYTKPWKEDETFQEALTKAKEMGAEVLESEAIRRAMDGRKPSDTLLIFLLKGAMPEKYAERHRLGGDKDAPPLAVKAVAEMSDEDLVRRAETLTRQLGHGNGGS